MSLESYIAIDNVCAWPNLTLLPDSSIAAVVFNQPNHGLSEGEVECWTSSDGGCNWTKRGVPSSHRPGENRMNVAAGLSANHDLIVLCSGWDRVPETFDPDQPPGRGNIAELTVSRSSDGGSTWSHGGGVPMPAEAGAIIPYGDIVSNGNGVLGASIYSFGKQQSGSPHDFIFSYFIRSYDDGKTWSEPVRIADRHRSDPLSCSETAVLSLGGDRVLTSVRTRLGRNLEIFLSEDFGETWTSKGQVTLHNQHPAHLLKLHDGRILMTYGMRNKGNYGICARLSNDEGESWDSPIFLVDFATATDGGYPSCVQLVDGTIVLAYYANQVPRHTRYHMGIVRFSPDDYF